MGSRFGVHYCAAAVAPGPHLAGCGRGVPFLLEEIKCQQHLHVMGMGVGERVHVSTCACWYDSLGYVRMHAIVRSAAYESGSHADQRAKCCKAIQALDNTKTMQMHSRPTDV